MLDDEFVGLLRPHLRFAETIAITDESSLQDLGLDSMHAVELLFAIEDAYDLEFPDELLNHETFRTAGTLWDVIVELRRTTVGDRG